MHFCFLSAKRDSQIVKFMLQVFSLTDTQSRTNLLIIYQFPIIFSIFPLDSAVRKTTDPFNSFARVYARSPILWLYMFLWHCVVFVHIILSFKSRSIALKCTKSQYSSVHDIMIPCDRITACFRSSPKLI